MSRPSGIGRASMARWSATSRSTASASTAWEGQGRLVLLLHGFPETSRAWRKQMPALAERFRVVAPDLRGFGASDKPKGIGAYRTSVVAQDIVGLIHAFDAERAHVVGHDWGGGAAWTVATLHPEAVDRLVVLNCPHPAVMARASVRTGPRSGRAGTSSRSRSHGSRNGRSGAARRRGSKTRSSAPRSHQLLRAGAKRTAQAADRRAARPEDYYRAAVRSRVARGKIKAPTLLIWAEDDFALGIELTRGMDGLFESPPRIEYVPNAGHWVMEERPELVNRLLLEFLA